MSVCPLDFRYGRAPMRDIFTEDARLRKLLEVEAALARAHARAGNIDKADAEAISKVASSGAVTVERVAAIEAEIRHDVMAVVRALTEQCGPAGRFVHLGATSNDIIDTAGALQVKEALTVLTGALEELADVLADLAERHAATPMVGRTHGQWAVPTTFGLKAAVFAAEVLRHLERLDALRERVCVGKMMGAVGTGAGLGPKALQVQAYVMMDLGLAAPMATTQVVQRDRLVELACALGNIVTSMEKFATEVRNLQRPEIGEVAEAFDEEKQVGSSTMAHKRNPIVAEKICGLARVARGFVVPMFESAVLWHERDLTNSSAERFIVPHMLILADEVVRSGSEVFRGLEVRPDAMARNLDAARGQVAAEPVMLALVDRGMGRQEAHELVRRCSMAAGAGAAAFAAALVAEPEVSSRLGAPEIQALLDPANYTGSAEQIVRNVVQAVRARQ
ncbi:MAG TPA: adenylosuccinate lyase [Candidatus Thermoplasmatota archaeon]